jgi:Uma2 family endonuclease
MSALPRAEPYTDLDEYLELETASPFRHELVDGIMYAMSGGSSAHNTLETNLLGMLHQQLRGRRCRTYGTNMKLRYPSQLGGEDEFDFFYPDAMVSCDPADGGETKGHAWLERPSVVFEILSPSTRRLDERRKRPTYLAISTLEAFVRIEQDSPDLIVDRRVEGEWVEERVSGLEQVLRLPSIGVELPLSELYERLSFAG